MSVSLWIYTIMYKQNDKIIYKTQKLFYWEFWYEKNQKIQIKKNQKQMLFILSSKYLKFKVNLKDSRANFKTIFSPFYQKRAKPNSFNVIVLSSCTWNVLYFILTRICFFSLCLLNFRSNHMDKKMLKINLNGC